MNKVHADYKGYNLCGTLTKHGRMRTADNAQVTCEKCIAKLTEEAK